MKSLIKIIFVFVLSISAYSQDCDSKLLLKTDISNFRVFINDSLEYKDQYEFELAKGFYNILVMEDSDRWNAGSFSDSFFIDSCETKELILQLSSDVLIDSEPLDVQVFAGDSLLGYTPIFIPKYFDTVTLKKIGYSEKEIVIDERFSKMNASLDFIGEPKKENFFDKPLSKVLIGSMLVLGAASAYFKIKADNNYDEFLRTGDVSYKDRTNEFDMISGVSLGLTQINFGFLIYKIFFDN